MEPLKILVIPDSHDKIHLDKDRYEWAGRLIVDQKPDVVVELGDFSDVESMSHFDKGQVQFEGRRFDLDKASAIIARLALTAPLLDLQAKQRTQKHKVWTPRLVALGGNHEYRIDRMMKQNPAMYGHFDQDISNAAQMGWEFHPFKEIVVINGVAFCHYFDNPNSRMGKPIAGVHPAYQLNRTMHTSSVQGHSHIFDHDVRLHRAVHKPLVSLIAGCYMEHDEDYAGHGNDMWWRGLTMLHTVQDGYFDVDQWSMDRVREHYSGRVH